MNIKKNRTIGIRTDDHFLRLLESACLNLSLRTDPVLSPRFDPPLLFISSYVLVNVVASFVVFIAASELALNR